MKNLLQSLLLLSISLTLALPLSLSAEESVGASTMPDSVTTDDRPDFVPDVRPPSFDEPGYGGGGNGGCGPDYGSDSDGGSGTGYNYSDGSF